MREVAGGSALLHRRFGRFGWGIGNYLGVVAVRFDKPSGPVFEIGEKFGVLGFVEFAGPQDFSGVDVGAVVDPFIVNIVVWFVAYDDEMFTWFL
jgi:hypothetical protein